MMMYTEVFPFRVEDEVKAGVEVHVLDKECLTTQCVNHSCYATVLKMINNSTERYYFWKQEEVKEEKEEPQATENEE